MTEFPYLYNCYFYSNGTVVQLDDYFTMRALFLDLRGTMLVLHYLISAFNVFILMYNMVVEEDDWGETGQLGYTWIKAVKTLCVCACATR